MATTLRVSWLAEHSEQHVAYASSVVQEHEGLAKHMRLNHARLKGWYASLYIKDIKNLTTQRRCYTKLSGRNTSPVLYACRAPTAIDQWATQNKCLIEAPLEGN